MKRLLCIAILICISGVCLASPLTFQDRLKAQRAVDRVYYNHLLWPKENNSPKPAFEYFYSESVIEQQVRNQLQKSELVDSFWHKPIRGEQLQDEMARIARQTKDPELLAELYKALNNDPAVIAETLGRDCLSDRLSRNLFNYDERIHFQSKQDAMRAFEAIQHGANLESLDPAHFVSRVLTSKEKQSVGQGMGVSETLDAYVVSKTETGTAETIQKTLRFPKLSFEEWLSQQNSKLHPEAFVSPETKYSFIPISPASPVVPSGPDQWSALWSGPTGATSAVWTGTEMIIPGTGGGRYNPSLDYWIRTSPIGAVNGPAVWTGTEMLVLEMPGMSAYNPTTDTWMSRASFPLTSRNGFAFLWTGSEALVWGGQTGNYAPPYNLSRPQEHAVTYGDGATYDPSTDQWTTMTSSGSPQARAGFAWAFSGSEFLVWGGFFWDCAVANQCGNGSLIAPQMLSSGAKYNLSTATWTSITNTGAPSAREFASGVWSGTEFIVWGGLDDSSGTTYKSGGRFNPATNSWTNTPTGGACPVARYRHSAIWAGDRMIVWGGVDGVTVPVFYNTGGEYIPTAGTPWQATPTLNGPTARIYHQALWTGEEMLIFGPAATGNRYDPTANAWAAIPSANGPSSISGQKAIFTGTNFISWGGQQTTIDSFGVSSTISTNIGGMYDLALDQWTFTSTSGAVPSARDQHSAIYTGTRMLVWGGQDVNASCPSKYFSDGSSFDPIANSWTALPSSGLIARSQHAAVWSGTSMIVFGGTTCSGTTNTGGVYTPGGSWSATSTTNAPSARQNAFATWTGTQMLVLGPGNDGGKYNPPPTNSWQSVTTTNAPASIAASTAINTGTEVIAFSSTGSPSGRYNIAGNTWSSLGTTGAPAQPVSAGVWTGHEGFYWNQSGSSQGNLLVAGPDTWSSTNVSSETPNARTGFSMLWTGNAAMVWGGGPGGGLYYPNTNPISNAAISTSVGGDTNLTLGTSETVSLNGGSSSDGSNPTTTTPDHDQYDSIVGYEWDLNGDAGFSGQCNAATSGVDAVGVSPGFAQSQLQTLGIAYPHSQAIWLRVTDEGGLKSCVSATLNLIDGTAPIVTVLTANGGESWPYSPDTVNRRYQTIIWSSSDNFGVTRSEISYSCNNGSSWACIADSQGTDCAAAGLTISGQSFLWTMPTISEASGQGQVFPSSTCKIRAKVWDTSNSTTDSSDNNFYIVDPTNTETKTLILWNSVQMTNKYGGAEASSLVSRLQLLSNHGQVNGVILDLNNVTAVATAYTAWNGAPTNQTFANNVATAIRNYIISEKSTTYTNAEYLIFVGDDSQIPFYRLSDGTTFYTETSYPPEVSLNTTTTVGSAIAAGKILTDNYYSELDPTNSGLPSPHDLVYLNDLAVGRLVETPQNMRDVIDTFLVKNGQLTLTDPSQKVLVSGYEFIYDSGKKIQTAFVNAGKNVDCLLDDPDAAGNSACIDKVFTAADLQNQLFGSTFHPLANINTHANHFNFGVPSGGMLSTTTMDGTANALTGGVLITSGCHSGLPVPNGVGSNTLDIPEEMARKKLVALVGNTGYGWGVLHGIGLTEALMQDVTDSIITSSSISIGKALAKAKRRYVLTQTRYDVFDEKVLLELSIFGIPNYLLINSNNGSAPTHLSLNARGKDSECSSGICVTKSKNEIPVTKGLPMNASLPQGMTQLDLNFAFGPGTYNLVSTIDGSYYELNGQSGAEVGDAIQPQYAYDSQLSGTEAHGVLFSAGAYNKTTSFNPVIAVPQSTNLGTGEGALPIKRQITPRIAVNRDVDGTSYTNSVLASGYFDSNNSTEFTFNNMQLTVYYSNSADTTAPLFVDPGASGFHTVSGVIASFSASVSDASGIYRVIVTYDDHRTNQWNSFDLTFNSNTNKWEGFLSLKGSITYYVQALDNAGNLGIISLTGQDLSGSGQPYGSTWSGARTWDINLPDTDADGLPDAYEQQHSCLSQSVSDATLDPDNDLLTTSTEFSIDTDPCSGDTDGGGDNDGSELHNGRNPLNKSDDRLLTILVGHVANTYTISWPNGTGNNSQIDGPYFVYRSTTAGFAPNQKINASPIADGVTSYNDVNPPCGSCFYSVWNYAINTYPPIVAAVLPSSGTAAGGTSVKIYGEYFAPGAVVLFGGTQGVCSFVSSSVLQCTTPAHSVGSVTVKVTNINSQEGSLANGFTFF